MLTFCLFGLEVHENLNSKKIKNIKVNTKSLKLLHTFVSRPHNVIKHKAEWMSLSKIDPNDVVSDPISDYLEKRSQWTQLAAPSFLKGVQRPGI